MLTPQELTEVVDTLHPYIDKLNAWIVNDIIERITARAERGEPLLLTSTDRWQIEVYKAAGGHYEALARQIERFTEATDAEIAAIFEDIGVQSWNADNAFYIEQGIRSAPFDQSERMIQILDEAYRRTTNTVHNFTHTTAKASQQRLITLLNDAHVKVMTGAASYTTAVKEAVNEIAAYQTRVYYPAKGGKTFYNPDTGELYGHSDTIETAVLRAVRTGVAQAAGDITMQGLKERQWDLIRTSAHLGARYGDGGENPSNHFWWQGKLYSSSGKNPKYPDFVTATGYGTGEGLCGWNCRHSFGPGSEAYNPYEGFDSEENKQAYDLSQKQRQAEARIRRAKLKVLALSKALSGVKGSGAEEDLQHEYEKAALQLQKLNQKYNQLCEKNGLKKLSDRISIAQWNRSEAAKATAAARRAKNDE